MVFDRELEAVLSRDENKNKSHRLLTAQRAVRIFETLITYRGPAVLKNYLVEVAFLRKITKKLPRVCTVYIYLFKVSHCFTE